MNEEKNTEDQETNKKSDESISKIAVTKDADRAINDALNRVNDGFEAGKATKTEVASWIILSFVKQCTDGDIHDMRTQFFNPILVLEAMVKKAKETGVVPEYVRKYLYDKYMTDGTIQRSAKRPKKALKDNAILDSIQNEGDAA